MDKLVITQEYKFQKGGSVFRSSEGEGIKVKLLDGNIYEGVLVEVGGLAQCFDIETENGVITIDCENVVDIMPVLETIE